MDPKVQRKVLAHGHDGSKVNEEGYDLEPPSGRVPKHAFKLDLLETGTCVRKKHQEK